MSETIEGNYLITVPDIGEGIAEVEIMEWNVQVGSMVEEDQVLCTVMTDKAAIEIPSPVDGKVTWTEGEVGEFIAVGSNFIRLLVEDEGDVDSASNVVDPKSEPSNVVKAVADDASSLPDQLATQTEPEPIENPAHSSGPTNISSASPTSTNTLAAPRLEGEKPIASPAVRQRARSAGINLNYVHGTGPAKRITHQDLDDFIAGNGSSISRATTVNTSVKEIKVVGLRRRIAAIMQDTMQRIPHFTYAEEIDVTELESLRKNLNAKRRDNQPKLTLLPFLIKALVKSLKAYPQMASHFDDVNEVVYEYAAAHIGIATQTPNGLVVPVVKHAEALDIWQSAQEIKRLADAARNGKAGREELSGSCITISSLGALGGIVTTPVINSPEVAIIGVNKIAKRPVWMDGAFIPREIMNLSSSFDHRIIDGWDATQFIHHFKELLEAPACLFMEEQE